MRLFAFVMALLGIFVYLLFHFSFWVVFGAMYMVGMIVVVLLASFGKYKASPQMVWNDSPERDQIT
jgi:ABC-type protease/lipase transport system fused ATPase/permease subunit